MTVPVRGGTLHAGGWGASGRGYHPVLAVHGITSSHRAWQPLADALGPARLVLAPDLRGRGGSAGLPPPYGMAAHADDLAALLDAGGVDRATVVGHSMGGFAAVVLADRHPDRVATLVLVDGGLPLAAPVADDVGAALDALLGPAMARLAMSFPDRTAYRDFWRAHPALGPYWTPAIEAYVDYDLAGDDGALRPRMSEPAVRADSRDLLIGSAYTTALGRLRVPATFLRAERGMLDEPVGLYPAERVAELAGQLPHRISLGVVPGNHYTAVLGAGGAAVIAAEIRAAGSAGQPV